MKVWVTGASGLCGRAVVGVLEKSVNVIPTAFSRVNDRVQKVDITDSEQVEAFWAKNQPDAVVHLAAERKPDICENKKEVTDNLNISASRFLAEIASKNNALFLYLSTDYVFDGTKPPYKPESKTNPLNYYGVSKLKGESVVQEVNPQACVLRVPVLYGEVEDLSESAITSICKLLLTDKQASVDHWATRFPTLVDDIGEVISKMLSKRPSGIFHFSGEEAFTKYETALMMGKFLGLETSHLVAQLEQTGSALRPKNAQLETSSLKEAGFYVRPTSINSVLKDILESHI